MADAKTSQLLFENPAAHITCEAAKYICLTLQAGPQESSNIQEAFKESFLLNQRTGLHRILLDQRRANPFLEVDKAWFTRHFAQLLAARDQYARVAHVVAADVFARLSTTSLAASIHRHGDWYKSFDEYKTAAHWLLA
jgi:hypothetical protein